MKLGLLNRGDYAEPVRRELEQMVASITTAYDVEHDEEGRQKQIWARWNLGADQSIANATVVLVQSTRPDALNVGDLTQDPVTGVVTVKTPGVYLAIGQVRWDPNATGARGAQILRNRIAVADRTYPTITVGGVSPMYAIEATVPCVAGTTLSFAVYQTSGAALLAKTAGGTSTFGTYFSITRVA